MSQRFGAQIGVTKKLILQGCGAAVGGAGSPWAGAGSTAGSGAFTLPSSHTHIQVSSSKKNSLFMAYIFYQAQKAHVFLLPGIHILIF
jgi:hypothetical protein